MGDKTTFIKVVNGKGDPVQGALVTITNISGNRGGKTDSRGLVTVETPAVSKLSVKVQRYGVSTFTEVKPGGPVNILLS
jgi:hypothetical protein